MNVRDVTHKSNRNKGHNDLFWVTINKPFKKPNNIKYDLFIVSKMPKTDSVTDFFFFSNHFWLSLLLLLFLCLLFDRRWDVLSFRCFIHFLLWLHWALWSSNGFLWCVDFNVSACAFSLSIWCEHCAYVCHGLLWNAALWSKSIDFRLLCQIKE